ncbi:MAG: class I SAM-dependent methyltransferase [Candidatus Dormibacteraeota bacterium]|nr:class I SAM-dependent methyltransferase [Candidatus Dormibacteraeota bacterium]
MSEIEGMSTAPSLRPRRGRYGFDAPLVPILLAAVAVSMLIGAGINARSGSALAAAVLVAGAVLMVLSATTYVYATRTGKFVVWEELLARLQLRGGERLLDVGCGRGAVLLSAAKLLPTGRAIGLDLWSTTDQSGNSLATTLANAELEGVGERVEVHTGDMRAMPFTDGEFDVVLSSLAIHNIPDRDGRAEAIGQMVRVLRPGGRLAIVDIRRTGEYAERAVQLGLTDVSRRPVGWRCWFGGPWVSCGLLTATKPA